MPSYVCASCSVVSVVVLESYCDGCVEEIVAYLERAETARLDTERAAEVSALFDRNYDLEYQRRYQDGLGFSY